MMLTLLNQKFTINWISSEDFGKYKTTWRKLALQLEAGSSFVNKLVVSDPRLPLAELK
jgi:hypothetical protein